VNKPARSEQVIFSNLLTLCTKPGYIHAIANFCFRDNVIIHSGDMKEADMRKMFSSSRLIRTEINTLIGLMIKGEVDWGIPAPKIVQEYMEEAEQLLDELHQCLSGEWWSGLTQESVASGFDPFKRGEAFREPIFYSGEAAYTFQYLDMAILKYAADAPWLQANLGFTIEQVSHVAHAVEKVHADNFETIRREMLDQNPDDWTMLPLFIFTAESVVAKTNLSVEVVELILDAFTLPSDQRNEEFNALHDFNAITATPLLRLPSGKFLSLQSYSLAEAVYEAPFYWMIKDKSYIPTLNRNRGDFTESFLADRLRLVFGEKHVHLNVNIFETKAKIISDIDVLVIWGNRVIIVQAKSKRLTLESRKGNDQVIRDDFKKAVQAAYDQGAACAKCLRDNRYQLVTPDGRDVVLPQEIKEIYLFWAISDHYPALSFQARQFLQTETMEGVLAPLVMDVFAVDAMTEMLQSPLQFLSYVNRRTNYADQLMASQELTILGYHLTRNLWVQPDVNMMHLEDDFSAGLDIAMAVRRAGMQGAETPNGVLTRLEKTTIGKIVKEIEARPDPATIDLGFLLLAMSEQAVIEMSGAVDKIAAWGRTDGKLHDATFAFKDDMGITFYCTNESHHAVIPRLTSYCALRKYKQNAQKWFGICLSPIGPKVMFGVSLIFPWKEDPILEEKAKVLKEAMPMDQVIGVLDRGRASKKKIGRNDLCACGSGLKYKKCCIN
jgi:hypothetical protein